MSPRSGREEGEALVTDAYLAALLAGQRGPGAVGMAGGAGLAGRREEMDPRLAQTAALIREHLRAVRPSFGFEERLAVQLRKAARAPEIGEGVGEILVLPRSGQPEPVFAGVEVQGTGVAPGGLRPIVGRRSGRLVVALVTGGLVASLVPLAGTALWVWFRRRGRGPVIASRPSAWMALVGELLERAVLAAERLAQGAAQMGGFLAERLTVAAGFLWRGVALPSRGGESSGQGGSL
jgi:hypothetical protein